MVTRRAGMWYPLNQLRNELDRQVSGWMNTLAPVAPARAFPAVNVWEKGDEFYAEAELPGVKSEDVEISVAGSELTIRGERSDAADESTTFHRRERGTGAFTRVLRLPVDVDSSRVQATLKDGVLLVTLPKHEAAKARKIQVTTT